jgi:hypothetical protein
MPASSSCRRVSTGSERQSISGYGRQRPVFILGENTPGYQSGAEKYMIHFRDARPKPGGPLLDAPATTFFSGISNIDIEIREGNPAAIAIRFHVAQLSSLEHMDFRTGAALGAVEAIGNEIEDCRFYGENSRFARAPRPRAGRRWCSIPFSKGSGGLLEKELTQLTIE